MLKIIESATGNRYFTIQRNIYLHGKVSSQHDLITPYVLLYNVEVPTRLTDAKRIIKLYRKDIEQYMVWHKIKNDAHLKDLVRGYRPYVFYVDLLEDDFR